MDRIQENLRRFGWREPGTEHAPGPDTPIEMRSQGAGPLFVEGGFTSLQPGADLLRRGAARAREAHDDGRTLREGGFRKEGKNWAALVDIATGEKPGDRVPTDFTTAG